MLKSVLVFVSVFDLGFVKRSEYSLMRTSHSEYSLRKVSELVLMFVKKYLY